MNFRRPWVSVNVVLWWYKMPQKTSKSYNSNSKTLYGQHDVTIRVLNPCHTTAVFSRRSGSSPDRNAERQHRRGIAVASPRNAVESPRTPRDGVFVRCKLQTPWDHRPLKNAVKTPCKRRYNAVQLPRTSWKRSKSVVRSPWERQGGR
jgi:hypothetical protein